MIISSSVAGDASGFLQASTRDPFALQTIRFRGSFIPVLFHGVSPLPLHEAPGNPKACRDLITEGSSRRRALAVTRRPVSADTEELPSVSAFPTQTSSPCSLFRGHHVK